MTDTLNMQQPAATAPAAPAKAGLLGRFAAQYSNTAVPFEVVMPDGSVQRFGQGAPSFQLKIENAQGQRAVASLDEGRIADAYLNGDIDLTGDMLRPFELRNSMKDFHFVTEAWRFIQPLLFGQVHTNKQAIKAHYDVDTEFFLSFLDPVTPCYTQGVYESADETLDVATLRKFDYAFEKLGLKAGDRILEIGPGWGAWFEYASKRGVKCTGITISQVSLDYLNKRSKELGYDWELILTDLLEYKTDRKYDAIVIMGVIEHLPDYLAVLKKFMTLVKPGGRIFLDGSAATKKYELSSFMVKYIYGGNHSFLVLHDFLDKLAKTPLQVEEIFNDRMSYYYTFVQWAKNFDAHKEPLVAKFGEFDFRRFRLYLWGAAYEFISRSLDCYRMIIQLPADAKIEDGK
ncbi:MAG TPA: class I SAM-dependent methyltransferase [Rhizomicrobium sp.]|jgi:cyclopropane-fatty-acyl-phospholipid synthase|nr:class I SAM-dependent methyltransferase [Rhizomicrobium sp.]